jgi:hypothetical protein
MAHYTQASPLTSTRVTRNINPAKARSTRAPIRRKNWWAARHLRTVRARRKRNGRSSSCRVAKRSHSCWTIALKALRQPHKSLAPLSPFACSPAYSRHHLPDGSAACVRKTYRSPSRPENRVPNNSSDRRNRYPVLPVTRSSTSPANPSHPPYVT